MGRARKGDGSITALTRRGRRVYRARLVHDGLERSEECRTRAEANQALERMRREAGLAETSQDLTMADYLDEWLSSLSLQPDTIRNYEVDVRLRIKPHLGAIRLRDLNGAHIEKFEAALTRAGVSAGLRSRTRLTLKSAIKTARRWQYIRDNPLEFVAAVSYESNARNPLTLEEARKILNARELECWPLWTTMLSLGLRNRELRQLAWAHLTDDGRLQVVGAKGKRQRVLPVVPLVTEALRVRRTQQLEQRLAAGPHWTNSDLVFTHADGLPFKADAIRYRWRRDLRRLGIAQRRAHDARHTAGELLIDAGIQQRLVMQILGHTSLSSSAHYTAQRDPAVRIALEAYTRHLLGERDAQ